MIYCSVINEAFTKDNNALLFSNNVDLDGVEKLSNSIFPIELDFLLSLQKKIKNDEFYFLDLNNGENFQIFIDIKDEKTKGDMWFLNYFEINAARVFCNLKDRSNFFNKFGFLKEGNFPFVVKGSLLKEIINYIKVLFAYGVFYYKIESYFLVLEKIIHV